MIEVALNTNILIYVLDKSNLIKRRISNSLIDDRCVISSQVLSEYMNICLRKFKKSKLETIDFANFIVSKSHFSAVTYPIILNGFELLKKHDFQIFDAIIVASALEAGCTMLYTEEMQHGLVVENQLSIQNPFL